MGNDKCVICAAPTARMPLVGNFIEFNCSKCRDYSINQHLLHELAASGQRLDVARTRLFLEDARSEGRVTTITHLDVTTRDLLRR